MRAGHRSSRARERVRGRCASLALVIALGGVSSPAAAQDEKAGAASTFFFGMSAGLLTLVYTPLKVVYATTSLPVSGLAYLWSVGNSEMAGRVMRSGTQGTYVLTPEHLTGEATIEFVGPAEEGPPEDEQRGRERR